MTAEQSHVPADARAVEIAAERRVRDSRLDMPADRANLHQKTLEALLDAYADDQGITGHDIAVRIGKAGVADHVGKLRRYGYQIVNVMEDGARVYRLETALPTPPPPLPNDPMPSREVIDAQRTADGLPLGVCDFCLLTETTTGLLQREHGHPAAYFGTSLSTRWLLACAQCNTRKRSACSTCPNRDPETRDRARCDGCFWGNPNSPDLTHTAGREVLLLPATPTGLAAVAALRARAAASGQTFEEVLAALTGGFPND